MKKNRNWKNDNYIMRKYGGSIYREIERSLKKAMVNIIIYEKRKVDDINLSLPGAFKDLSQSVGWNLKKGGE